MEGIRRFYSARPASSVVVVQPYALTATSNYWGCDETAGRGKRGDFSAPGRMATGLFGIRVEVIVGADGAAG